MTILKSSLSCVVSPATGSDSLWILALPSGLSVLWITLPSPKEKAHVPSCLSLLPVPKKLGIKKTLLIFTFSMPVSLLNLWADVNALRSSHLGPPHSLTSLAIRHLLRTLRAQEGVNFSELFIWWRKMSAFRTWCVGGVFQCRLSDFCYVSYLVICTECIRRAEKKKKKDCQPIYENILRMSLINTAVKNLSQDRHT